MEICVWRLYLPLPLCVNRKGYRFLFVCLLRRKENQQGQQWLHFICILLGCNITLWPRRVNQCLKTACKKIRASSMLISREVIQASLNEDLDGFKQLTSVSFNIYVWWRKAMLQPRHGGRECLGRCKATCIVPAFGSRKALLLFLMKRIVGRRHSCFLRRRWHLLVPDKRDAPVAFPHHR